MRWVKGVSLLSFFGGWAGVFLLIYGIPGHIDNATTWLRWLFVPSQVAWVGFSAAFIMTGPIVWTSGWWWPRVSRRLNRPQPVTERSKVDTDDLKGCLPQIERCRQLLQRYIAPFGQSDMVMAKLSHVMGGDSLIKLQSEFEYLSRQLCAFGLTTPPIPDSAENLEAIHHNLHSWRPYLAKLEVAVQHGDIEGARLAWEGQS